MRDEWFIRGSVPMTKSEIRAVSLSKLELHDGCVLWDIGAGTGSVSVEAALSCPGCLVAAFEKKAEAVELIRKNREKAAAGNLWIVEGEAPDSFRQLDCPGFESVRRVTHAFLGGTSGRMEPVIGALLKLNPGIRIVINTITLESTASALECLKRYGIEAEILSMQIAKAEKAGPYHMMKGQNPVYIISFGG